MTHPVYVARVIGQNRGVGRGVGRVGQALNTSDERVGSALFLGEREIGRLFKIGKFEKNYLLKGPFSPLLAYAMEN
jgi:hypothetical protein